MFLKVCVVVVAYVRARATENVKKGESEYTCRNSSLHFSGRLSAAQEAALSKILHVSLVEVDDDVVFNLFTTDGTRPCGVAEAVVVVPLHVAHRILALGT